MLKQKLKYGFGIFFCGSITITGFLSGGTPSTHVFGLVNNKILKILGFVKTHKMEVLLLFNYDKLKTAIEASGKSKTYLCKRLERPPYYLRDVIRQKNNIPDEYQKILATELGVTVEYLNDQDEKKPASVSADGQADKLAKALDSIGIDVESLSESEINRIARLAKAVLEE